MTDTSPYPCSNLGPLLPRLPPWLAAKSRYGCGQQQLQWPWHGCPVVMDLMPPWHPLLLRRTCVRQAGSSGSPSASSLGRGAEDGGCRAGAPCNKGPVLVCTRAHFVNAHEHTCAHTHTHALKSDTHTHACTLVACTRPHPTPAAGCWLPTARASALHG